MSPLNKILPLLLCALFTACSSKPPHPRWLWPVPPAQPRLEFIRTFSSEIDLLPNRKERVLATINKKGAEQEIYFPFGLSTAGEQQVILADQDQRALRQYDLQTGKVKLIAGSDILQAPLDLQSTADGSLYLIDQNRILKIPASGEIRILVPDQQLTNPAYLAINPQLQRLYVSDSKENHIRAFDLEGQPLFTFGKAGQGKGELFAPQGMAIDNSGQIFVADYFNARIQVFDADGNYLRQFGQRGNGPADFEGPKDLAFDSEQQLHIVDSRRNALLTYSPQGELLLVTGGGTGTAHPLGFSAPANIYIDPNDRIYISDRLNHRVSIWQYLNPAYLEKHPITADDLEQIDSFMKKR